MEDSDALQQPPSQLPTGTAKADHDNANMDDALQAYASAAEAGIGDDAAQGDVDFVVVGEGGADNALQPTAVTTTPQRMLLKRAANALMAVCAPEASSGDAVQPRSTSAEEDNPRPYAPAAPKTPMGNIASTADASEAQIDPPSPTPNRSQHAVDDDSGSQATTSAFSQMSMQPSTAVSSEYSRLVDEFDPLGGSFLTTVATVTTAAKATVPISFPALPAATPQKGGVSLLDFASPAPISGATFAATASTDPANTPARRHFASRIPVTPGTKPHLLDLDTSLSMSPASVVQYSQHDVNALVEQTRQSAAQAAAEEMAVQLERMRTEYEAKLQQQASQHAEAKKKHDEELQSIVADTNALVTEHETLMQRVSTVEAQLQQEASEKHQMTIVLDDNAKEMARLNNEIARERARASGQVDDIRKDNMKLDFEVKAWESKCAKVKMMLDEREELVGKYAANETQMMSTIEQLKNDLMSTEKIVDSIKAQAEEKLKTASVEISKIKHQHNLALAAHSLRVVRAETQLREAEQKLARLQAELDAKTQHNQELLDICDHALCKIDDQTAEEDVAWAAFLRAQQERYPNGEIKYESTPMPPLPTTLAEAAEAETF
ncbi:Transforming acidic coiled-coil-containing protein 3 [Sorochytrium milnesiophthora]